MPTVRPFRALRYDPTVVSDASAVICPPYDVISPERRASLAARHPRNAVHVELPVAPAGEPAGERYRSAARAWVQWRSDGTLRKDRQQSVYVYEQHYGVPGWTERRITRGVFARVRLEPLTPAGPVRAHERTMSGPKEDRLQLLRACGANLSPVVMLYEHGGSEGWLDTLTATAPDTEARDDDATLHRLWVCEIDASERGAAAGSLLAAASAGPLTIADGHHRYETALAYREERGRHRACESDPGYDYVMSLLHDAADTPLTVLATHRLVRGGPTGPDLLHVAERLFEVERLTSREELLAAFPPARAAGGSSDPASTGGGTETGTGRFGVWTGGAAAILRARPGAFEPLFPSGIPDPVRRLDVRVLGVALEQLLELDEPALVAGERVHYARDAAEALERVDRGDAQAAFLLDPTPVSAVTRVAAQGEVMPQKSTYFHPKAATGLLFNPLES